MPRDGSGNYTKAAGSTAVPNTVIESAKYNAAIDDIAADLNLARPIVSGGTGGTTAVSGGDNLSTKGADMASGATTDIGTATGRYVHITGTTTITSFGTKTAGVLRVLTFDGALTLTHNATTLILPNAASILTAAGDVGVFVSEGGGNWRCVSYNRASGASARAAPGHLFGLTLANNATDATNDIDIAVGEAASDAASPVLITLASAITKRLDAAWAVGSGNGGLDTGSIANGTYHIWLIQRSDTGVVDALFSTSATAPTMPTNYDRKRRVGSILREAGTNVAFTQNGDVFQRNGGYVTDAGGVTLIGSTLTALSVPSGIVVSPIILWAITASSGGTLNGLLGSFSAGFANTTLVAAAASTNDRKLVSGSIFTDTNRQIWISRTGTAGTTSNLATGGWIDTRGRI